MNHTQFQKKVTDLLKDKGCWTFNVHGGMMQKSGVPDLLVIGVYWTGFLEFKIGKDKCRKLQEKIITEIKQRRFPVYVLRYDKQMDAIQIEDQHGIIYNFIAWEALYGWLKNPIHVTYKEPKNEMS
jgi:hypothetical protein